jgi:pimeloyl-ACP methyl ester carboxylesterase
VSDLGSAMLFDGECVVVDPTRATDLFFHDCELAVAEAATARLRPQSRAAFGGIPRNVAWREKPSTYIVCTDDRAVPVGLQRASAARVDQVLEMPTSHSPFLSRPEELARMLAELAVL